MFDVAEFLRAGRMLDTPVLFELGRETRLDQEVVTRLAQVLSDNRIHSPMAKHYRTTVFLEIRYDGVPEW